MKYRILGASFACIFACLTACTPAAASLSLSASGGDDWAANSSSNTIVEANGLPFPEIVNAPTIELGFDPQDKIYSPLKLEYTIQAPEEGFFEALRNMDDKTFATLLDKKNYFAIGEYVLSFHNLSFVGPSRIYIDRPNGKTVEVFSSTQPIWQVNFLPQNRTLVLEMSHIVYADGDDSLYYELDLQGKTLQVSGIGAGTNSEAMYGALYYGRHYRTLLNLETGEGLLTCRIADDEYEEITKVSASGPVFADGNIYYMKPQNDQIYYRSVKNLMEEAVVPAISAGPGGFSVSGGKIVYPREEEGVNNFIIADIKTGSTLTTLRGFPKWGVVAFAEKGIYALDNDRTLWFCGYDDNKEPIFTGMENVFIQGICDNWLYFMQKDEAFLGRINLDGSGLQFYT